MSCDLNIWRTRPRETVSDVLCTKPGSPDRFANGNQVDWVNRTVCESKLSEISGF